MSREETRKYIDRREYMIAAVAKRRKKVKRMAVEYKGGKCSLCGYDRCVEALDFHHRDPDTKKFGIGYKGYKRSWDVIKKEVDKCEIVCANCHREIGAGVAKINNPG